MKAKQTSYLRASLRVTKDTALACLFALSGLMPVGADILRGGVEQDDIMHRQAPSLNRDDLKNTNGGDAFEQGNGGERALEIPKNAFGQTSDRPPPPPKLNANVQQRNDDFDGTPQQAINAAPPPPPQNRQPPLMANAQQASDPDEEAGLQLEWDAWHKRVASEIYKRFLSVSHTAFAYSRPLGAYVSYTVTRDGHITNVQLEQKSSNIMFNTMLIMVIKSLDGQGDLLAFPPGSKRMTVDKGGQFTQNYGQQGFKYTIHDRETIKPAH